jgi:O-antigen ligase
MRNKIQSIALILVGSSMPLAAYSKGYFFASLGLGVLLGLVSLSLQEYKDSLNKVLSSKMLSLILLVMLTIMCSVYVSIDQTYSLKKLGDICIVLFFSLGLFVFLDNVSVQKMKLVIKSMLILTMVNVCYLYYDMFIASKEMLIKIHGIDNISTGRVRYPANQMAVFAPLLFGYLFDIEKKQKLAWAFLGIVTITIFATGGRSAMLALLCSTTLMVSLLIWKKAISLNVKKGLLIILSVGAVLFSGVFVYKYFDKSSGENVFERRMTTDSSNISSGRFAIWKFAIEEGLKSPVFGVGIGSFRKLGAETELKLSAKNHPHNFLIEIFVSTGFVGLFAMALLGVCLFIKIFKQIFADSLFAIFAVSSYTAYWVNSAVSVSILQTYWLAFFTVCTIIGYTYVIKINQLRKIGE